MLLKQDLEKAFDRIEWCFVRQALQFFNFTSPLIKLIMFCIITTSLSILINGSRSPPFYPSYELRQGDLPSPYLFCIMYENAH